MWELESVCECAVYAFFYVKCFGWHFPTVFMQLPVFPSFFSAFIRSFSMVWFWIFPARFRNTHSSSVIHSNSKSFSAMHTFAITTGSSFLFRCMYQTKRAAKRCSKSKIFNTNSRGVASWYNQRSLFKILGAISPFSSNWHFSLYRPLNKC